MITFKHLNKCFCGMLILICCLFSEVGMIAVLTLIWGGVNYLTSAGDEDKAKTGKKTIQYAIIGLVVAGIAYALVNVIITVIL